MTATKPKRRGKKKATIVGQLTQQNVRITGDEREHFAARLARGYSSGKAIRALATENNRSYGNVHQLLVEAGVDLRPRGGSRRGN